MSEEPKPCPHKHIALAWCPDCNSDFDDRGEIAKLRAENKRLKKLATPRYCVGLQEQVMESKIANERLKTENAEFIHNLSNVHASREREYRTKLDKAKVALEFYNDCPNGLVARKCLKEMGK